LKICIAWIRVALIVCLAPLDGAEAVSSPSVEEEDVEFADSELPRKWFGTYDFASSGKSCAMVCMGMKRRLGTLGKAINP
jgi:hypothetical protein